MRFEFPKGVKPQTYVVSGTDANGVKASRQVKIAFSDGKFFISGLASKLPEEVYEGTYSGTATASDRALYDFDPTGISLNTAAKQPVSTRYYSMEGAQIATPAKGAIVLKSVTYADGEHRVTKEIVK